MATRILFLGTPEFACPTLEALIRDKDRFEIVGVVTQPDRPAGRNLGVQPSRVKTVATNYLTSLSRLEKKFTIYSPENVNDEEFLDQISGKGIQLAIVVAFGQILSP